MFRIIIGCKTSFFFLDTIKRSRTSCVCFSLFFFCVYSAQAVINAGLVPLIIAVLKVCKHDTNSLVGLWSQCNEKLSVPYNSVFLLICSESVVVQSF